MEPTYDPEERAEQEISGGGTFSCASEGTYESAAGMGGEKTREFFSKTIGQLSQGMEAFKESASQRVRSLAMEQKDRVVDGLQRLSRAIHDTASSLEREGDQTLSRYADDLGAKVDKMTNYVQEHEPAQLLQDSSRCASRNIGAVVGGMFLVGVIVAKLLQSTRRPTQTPEETREPHFESDQGRRTSATPYTPQTSRFTETEGMPGQPEGM